MEKCAGWWVLKSLTEEKVVISRWKACTRCSREWERLPGRPGGDDPGRNGAIICPGLPRTVLISTCHASITVLFAALVTLNGLSLEYILQGHSIEKRRQLNKR